jgi:hypothetical protein
MDSRKFILAVTAATGALGAPFATASATTLFPEQFTCPIGGEVFEDYVIGSYTSWGQRPDGKLYGTLPVYPIVECPGNGFPIFDDELTPAELAVLTPLVESSRFQAMRESETPHYRAWWLMKALQRPPAILAVRLLMASWETDEDPSRKQRYQREFLAAAAEIPATEGEDWFWLNLRAANALRELARFEEAAALLARLEGGDAWPTDADEIEAARYLIDGLAALVGEGNVHPEPANLIPPQMAVERCTTEFTGLTDTERVACSSPAYLAAKAEWAEYEIEVEYGDHDEASPTSQAALAAEAAMADAEANLEAAVTAVEFLADEQGCYEKDGRVYCTATVLIEERD